MNERHGDTKRSLAVDEPKPAKDDRRAFLKVVGLTGLGAGLAATIAAPGVALLVYPLEHETVSGGTGFLAAGDLSQFDPGKPVKVDLFADKRDAWNRVVQVKVGSAWVVNQGGKLTAYSTVCPHLGCAVDYDSQEKKFKCPCHRSAFGVDGAVQGGPSPRPMDRLETKIEGDKKVAIRYERYKQGITEKERV